jgi:hypothetical protein
MNTNEHGDGIPRHLRVWLLLSIVRGAVSGAVHAGVTWLINQFTEAQ